MIQIRFKGFDLSLQQTLPGTPYIVANIIRMAPKTKDPDVNAGVCNI